MWVPVFGEIVLVPELHNRRWVYMEYPESDSIPCLIEDSGGSPIQKHLKRQFHLCQVLDYPVDYQKKRVDLRALNRKRVNGPGREAAIGLIRARSWLSVMEGGAT